MKAKEGDGRKSGKAVMTVWMAGPCGLRRVCFYVLDTQHVAGRPFAATMAVVWIFRYGPSPTKYMMPGLQMDVTQFRFQMRS